jgi:peptide-methionine (S)-S-oxide reductase
MFSFLFGPKTQLVTPEAALPGRAEGLEGVGDVHHVLGTSLRTVPPGAEVAVFGLGCFWGAEKVFWQLPGVLSTSVGYAGGYSPNATYQEVCSGATGHAEVVRVFFDPARIDFTTLCRKFFESHDPTQGMRQGHDVGTQYRSVVLTMSEAQRAAAQGVLEAYQAALLSAGHVDPITTEIAPLTKYYFAEDYHQQYLAKNPGGYCGLGGTGVSCPTGLAST